MSAVTSYDAVVVGAGLAGLAAATTLVRAGCSCLVLEAAPRIGGRAFTAYPPELGGVWFDMGAMWFHDAARNPLVPMARAAGVTLLASDAQRQERSFIGNRTLTATEQAEYDGAWTRFEDAAAPLLAEPDTTLSAVAARLPHDPWAHTVAAWEGAVIAAADAERLSLRDWHRNQLHGQNLMPAGGIGAFVAEHLGRGLPIETNCAVRRIRRSGPGGAVTLETDRGEVVARAAIVTVSTGVLAAGGIVFDPPLPASTQAAIAALPMGLAVKIVLRAAETDRLDLPGHTSVDYRVGAGETLMPFQCWPFGRDYVQAWLGGQAAWDLSRQGQGALVEVALDRLVALFGGRARSLFAVGPHLITHWGEDTLIRGAYCYAVPGGAASRAALGEPIDNGHLMLAGEGCATDGLAGTLAGAWNSGTAAAHHALAALERSP